MTGAKRKFIILVTFLVLSGFLCLLFPLVESESLHQKEYSPSQFSLETFNKNMNVTTFASPDGSKDTLSHFLTHAQESIYVEIYGIDNPYILDILHEIHTSNPTIDMKFLLGYNSLDYYSSNDYVANNLTLLGYPVKWTSDSEFTYAHQKFVIIDNKTTIVHSGNWAKTSFPEDGMDANREWSIAMTDTDVTDYYRSVFDYDWGNGVDYNAGTDGTGTAPSYIETSSTYPRPFASPGHFSGPMNVTPIVGPDTGIQGILYCINAAQVTLDIQIPYFTNYLDGGSVDTIVNAIIAAKERGVTVRVISEEDYDYLEIASLFKNNSIPIVWQDTRWCAANHNKGIIVDGRIVLISSINFGDNSIENNREVGVIIEHEGVAQWYLEVFDYDWGMADFSNIGDVNVYWDPNIPNSSTLINVTVFGHELYDSGITGVYLSVKIDDGIWTNYSIIANDYESAEGDPENYFYVLPAQADTTNITVKAYVFVGGSGYVSDPIVIRVRDSIPAVLPPTTFTTPTIIILPPPIDLVEIISNLIPIAFGGVLVVIAGYAAQATVNKAKTFRELFGGYQPLLTTEQLSVRSDFLEPTISKVELSLQGQLSFLGIGIASALSIYVGECIRRKQDDYRNKIMERRISEIDFINQIHQKLGFVAEYLAKYDWADVAKKFGDFKEGMSANEVYQKINSLDTTLCDTIWKNLRIIELPDTKESPPAIKSLREDVEEKFKPKSYNIELQLDDENPDKFEESKEQLKKYAPTIETYGLDLRHERRNNDYWGGLLARSITSRENPKKKCLQYVYVWHRQTSAISLHWLVVVPAVLTLLGAITFLLWSPGFLLEPRPPESLLEVILQAVISPTVGYLILLIETFATGFGPYISRIRKKDPNKPNPHHLPAVATFFLYIFLSLLMIVNHSWWLISSILAIIVTVILWGITTNRRWLTSHDMDYLPVFVWLEEIDQKWVPKEICYDYWHYYSCKRSIDEKSSEQFRKNPEKGYIKLRMDNPWHSVYKHEEVSTTIRLLIIIATGVILGSLFWALGYFVQATFFIYSWRVILILVMTLVLYNFDSLISQKGDLVSPAEFDEEVEYLDYEWLRLLWNLFDNRVKYKREIPSHGEIEKTHQPRLVVVTKMQRPFMKRKSFWTSFRDDHEDIYCILQESCNEE